MRGSIKQALFVLCALTLAGCEESVTMAPPQPSSTAPAPATSSSAASAAPKRARLASFLPPGDLDDFPAGKEAERKAFRHMWSATIDEWTEQAILGDPWTVDHDQDRKLYFNPLKTDVPENAQTVQVTWFPFPNRLREYFLGKPFTADEIYELADNGKLKSGAEIPKLPSKICPQIDAASEKKDFFPKGSRGWQDEYMEWSVTRDPKTKKIVSVMFTSENPDYWRALWDVDPELVTDLYRKLLHNPKVQKEDLYLKLDGKVVTDPVTQRPAYNMLNKWNTGTEIAPDHGGAVHLTSAPNTLRAEIYLAAAATLLRTDDKTAQDLTCASQFGQNFRNSDPHIGFVANQMVKNQNVRISLAQPVGLYIQDPDFSRFKLPKNAPAGLTARDLWKVVRGTPGGQAMHAVFEVPAKYGFTVSDILIDDKPVRWASQITETLKIGLSLTAFPSSEPVQAAQPKVEDRKNPLAQPILMSGFDQLRAAPTVDRDTPWFAHHMKAGTTIKGMGLAVRAYKDNAAVAFTGDGVTAKVISVVKTKSPTDGDVALLQLDVTIAPNATPGLRDVNVTNPGQAPGPAGRGFMVVEP